MLICLVKYYAIWTSFSYKVILYQHAFKILKNKIFDLMELLPGILHYYTPLILFREWHYLWYGHWENNTLYQKKKKKDKIKMTVIISKKQKFSQQEWSIKYFGTSYCKNIKIRQRKSSIYYVLRNEISLSYSYMRISRQY